MVFLYCQLELKKFDLGLYTITGGELMNKYTEVTEGLRK